MTSKIYLKIKIVLLFSIILGCSQSTNLEDNSSDDNQLIHINQAQFESEKMQIGEITDFSFEQSINCQGYITSPPNGMIQLNPRLSGKIDEIKCTEGQSVKKGQVLLQISTKELIILQQDYIKASATLKRLEAEYNRKKALHKEDIGAEKDLLLVETEYKIIQAEYKSLQLQLQLLNLNISEIENGAFYNTYPIIAPMNGTITNLDVVLGQFIETQTNLLELIDMNQLQLKISVFEKDIHGVSIGDKVYFNHIDNILTQHLAKIISISKTINPETKAIECIASITRESTSNHINGAFVEAKIIVDTKTSKALPLESILKKNKKNFVYAVKQQNKDGVYVDIVEIYTGNKSKEFVEVLDTNFNEQVLLTGIYNLPSE